MVQNLYKNQLLVSQIIWRIWITSESSGKPKKLKFTGLHLSKNTFLQLKHTEDLSNVIFSYLCENSPNSVRHFWNYKSFFTTQFLCIILSQALHTFDKNISSKCKFSDFPLLELKLIKCLSFFKQKVSFSSKFESLFNVMR